MTHGCGQSFHPSLCENLFSATVSLSVHKSGGQTVKLMRPLKILHIKPQNISQILTKHVHGLESRLWWTPYIIIKMAKEPELGNLMDCNRSTWYLQQNENEHRCTVGPNKWHTLKAWHSKELLHPNWAQHSLSGFFCSSHHKPLLSGPESSLSTPKRHQYKSCIFISVKTAPY